MNALKIGISCILLATIIIGFIIGYAGWAFLVVVGEGVILIGFLKHYYPEQFFETPTLRYPTTPVTCYLTINRPTSVVWDVLITIDEWSQWWGELKDVSPGWVKGGILQWAHGGSSKITDLKYGRRISISSGSVVLSIILYPRGSSTLIYFEDRPVNGTTWTDGGVSRFGPMQQSLHNLKKIVEVK